jgi:hypothetical protein
MFRAVRRSLSGALTVFAASGLHTHVVTGRSQVCVGYKANSHVACLDRDGIIVVNWGLEE